MFKDKRETTTFEINSYLFFVWRKKINKILHHSFIKNFLGPGPKFENRWAPERFRWGAYFPKPIKITKTLTSFA